MKFFTTRNLSRALFTGALFFISLFSYNNSGGPGGGNTGAPGESACGGCHGSATTSGAAFDAITLSGVTGGNYAPGQTYTITVAGNTAATSKNGFQVTALSPSNAMAGSFTAGTGNSVSTSGSRSYVTHNNSALSTWTFQWTAPNPAVGTVTFYLAYNATNSSSSTSGDVVYAKSFAFTSGNVPVVSITSPTNGATFCVGDTVQFNGSATNNPTSFAWDFLGNVPSTSTQQNPRIVVGPTAGTKTIRFRATNASGTSTNAQIFINVIAKPTATITASNTVICGSDSVTLTANSGNNLSYLWSPGGQTTQTIKTINPGSYTVRLTNSNNCATTSAATVLTASPKPFIVVNTDKDTICSGDSIKITATAGMQYYRYFANNVLIDSTASNEIFHKPNTSTNYTVIATAGPCNSNTAAKQIIVNSKPAAPVITCGQGSPSQVVFTISGANPQISLDTMKTWQTPNQGNNHVVSGLSPNKQVLLYARNGVGAPCLFSLAGQKTCIAANCPPITYKVIAPVNVCGASTAKIKVTQTNATLPWYSFSNGTTGSNGFISSDSFEIALPLLINSITIKVIDSANALCPSKDTTFIINRTNISNPYAFVTLNKQLFCPYDSLTLNASSVLPTVDSISYFKGNTFLGVRTRKQGFAFGPNAIVPVFPQGTEVKLIARDSVTGCTTQSPIVTIQVRDIPSVGFTYLTNNLNIELNDTSSATVNRLWLLEGDTFPASNRIYNYTFGSAGSKQIVMHGFNASGCRGIASRAIIINATGINEQADAFGLSIFPNPTESVVSINWQSAEPSLALAVYNQAGQKVISKNLQKGEVLDLGGLSSGVYLLSLSDGTQVSHKKISLR